MMMQGGYARACKLCEFFYAQSFGAKSVSLLGSTIPLKFKASKMGVSVEPPDLPEELRSQPAWVLKISR